MTRIPTIPLKSKNPKKFYCPNCRAMVVGNEFRKCVACEARKFVNGERAKRGEGPVKW